MPLNYIKFAGQFEVTPAQPQLGRHARLREISRIHDLTLHGYHSIVGLKAALILDPEGDKKLVACSTIGVSAERPVELDQYPLRYFVLNKYFLNHKLGGKYKPDIRPALYPAPSYDYAHAQPYN